DRAKRSGFSENENRPAPNDSGIEILRVEKRRRERMHRSDEKNGDEKQAADVRGRASTKIAKREQRVSREYECLREKEAQKRFSRLRLREKMRQRDRGDEPSECRERDRRNRAAKHCSQG